MKQFSFSKIISHIYLSDQQQIMILAIGFFIIFIAIFVILRIFSDETAKRKPKKVKQEVYDENEDSYEEDEKEISIKRSKKAIQYEEKYLTFWNETRDIKATLNKLEGEYKSSGKEGKAIRKAIEYLEKSIMKDYQTAFSYIENVFNDDEIRRIHEESIKYIYSHLLSGNN